MATQDYNQFAGTKISRIEALSDGIFAVAMTLLVLEIKVPVGENVTNERELFTLLVNVSPKMLVYFLSFMTLGIFWVGQAAQFKFITKTDRHLTWISIFFLMFVSLIPFTTAFLGEYINFKTAVALYWLNIFALGATLYVHWVYACRNKLYDESLDINLIDKAVRNRIFYAQILYAIGATLCFINTYLSVSVIILIQLNYALALFYKPKRRSENLAHS